jgi:glycine hydroxymethyltransferase
MDFLRNTDPAIADLLRGEFERQRTQLEMIASENFTSLAVMEAMGSVLTNKYAEGYPGRRYYGGCEVVDEVERLARSRACELFGAAHANVQPHSGSTANMTAYLSLAKPGDRILGLSLSHGGHLTHGHAVNFSGMLFEAHHYEVDRETEQIDYDALATQARELRPAVLVAGSSAYPRAWNFERIGAIARELAIPLVVDMAHFAGLVAAGLHPDPVPHADVITTTTHKTLRGPRGGLILANDEHFKSVNKINFPGIQGGPFMHVIAAKAVCFHEAMSDRFREDQARTIRNAQVLGETLIARGLRLVSGGTDTHLLLVDLRSKSLTGKDGEAILEQVGITVNKNTIPFDPESPFVTSGVRIGTPALTSRGMGEEEMREIGEIIDRALTLGAGHPELGKLRERSRALAAAFPLYPEIPA